MADIGDDLPPVISLDFVKDFHADPTGVVAIDASFRQVENVSALLPGVIVEIRLPPGTYRFAAGARPWPAETSWIGRDGANNTTFRMGKSNGEA